MDRFTEINPEELDENVFRCLGREWMLIAAGTEADGNAMTASWGGFGFLWNRPVATVYVRPERHTADLLAVHGSFSLNFFAERYRPALQYCGSHSGRDGDKLAACNLEPFPVADGRCIAVREARLVIVCRTLYAQRMEEALFLEPDINQFYGEKGTAHTMYIGAIERIFRATGPAGV